MDNQTHATLGLLTEAPSIPDLPIYQVALRTLPSTVSLPMGVPFLTEASVQQLELMFKKKYLNLSQFLYRLKSVVSLRKCYEENKNFEIYD